MNNYGKELFTVLSKGWGPPVLVMTTVCAGIRVCSLSYAGRLYLERVYAQLHLWGCLERTCSIENSSLSDYTYLYVLEKFRFMFCGFIKSDLYSKPCSKYQRYIELQSFLENEIMPYLDVGDFLLWDRILPGQWHRGQWPGNGAVKKGLNYSHLALPMTIAFPSSIHGPTCRLNVSTTVSRRDTTFEPVNGQQLHIISNINSN